MMPSMLGADPPSRFERTLPKGICKKAVPLQLCCGVSVELSQLVGSDAVCLQQRPIRASPVAAYRLPRWRAAAGLALSRGGGGRAGHPIRAGLRKPLSSSCHKARCRVRHHTQNRGLEMLIKRPAQAVLTLLAMVAGLPAAAQT